MSVSGHPTCLHCGYAKHQGIIRYIAAHHCSGTYEGVSPNDSTAYNGRIGSNCGTPANKGPLVGCFPVDLRAGIDHIGKDARRPQENIILDDHTRINGDIILDFDIVANDHLTGDHDILTQRAALSDARVFHDVAEMPDARPGADLAGFVYITAGVNKINLFSHF